MTFAASLHSDHRCRSLLMAGLTALLLFGGLSQALASEQGPRPAKVQLLFPLLRGDEQGRLQPLMPSALVVEINGQRFVRLGSYADARVAYRLGRSIQRQLQLPFDLAYEPGHPQLDGAWLVQLKQAKTSAAPAPQASAAAVLSPSTPTDWAATGVPLTRLAGARNPELDYLLVQVEDLAALKRLQSLTPVTELILEKGRALARVGVFTRNSQGWALLQQRLARLRGLEPTIVLLLARNGELVATA